MEGKRFLVVPTCRPAGFRDFLRAWEGRGGWDAVVLVEDAPVRTPELTPLVDYHYSHAEIEGILGRDAWIISRRDSAIRCFGFLAAYHLGASHVLTLDDDVRPYSSHPLFDAHVLCMRHVRFAPILWGNFRSRGLPYRNVGEMRTVTNVGLWSNIGDWDAMQTLVSESDRAYYTPPSGNRILPHGQYVPTCGMNLCIARDALPLWYFPLMGEGQPFRRFDDIWAGIIAKKACDHLHWHISAGDPVVEHIRASDPFVNLVKEAPGIAANETFWEEIDQIKLPAYAVDAVTAVDELGSGLESRGSTPYLTKVGEALRVWAGLFSQPLALSESPPESAPVQT